MLQDEAVRQQSLVFSSSLCTIQIAAVLIRLFVPLTLSSTYTSTSTITSTSTSTHMAKHCKYSDPTNPLNLHATVAIQVDQTELTTDVPSAVIETICSILELSPFRLVEVEGTHLDTVTVKLKHITPTALQVAAATDCVLAALLKIQLTESKEVGGGSGGGGIGGVRAGECNRVRSREIESTSNMYSDNDDDYGSAQDIKLGGRGGGNSKGYGDLVPQFCVSLLHLVNESTSVIFEAEKGAMYSTVTAMTRYVRTCVCTFVQTAVVLVIYTVCYYSYLYQHIISFITINFLDYCKRQ